MDGAKYRVTRTLMFIPLICTLAVGGCGGDESGDESGDTPTAETETAGRQEDPELISGENIAPEGRDPVPYRSRQGLFAVTWPSGCNRLRTRKPADAPADTAFPGKLPTSLNVFCDRTGKKNEGCTVRGYYNERAEDGGPPHPRMVTDRIEAAMVTYGVEVVSQNPISWGDLQGVDVRCREPDGPGEVWLRGVLAGPHYFLLAAWKQSGGLFEDEEYANNTSKWSAMREAIVAPGRGVVSTTEGLIEFGLVIYSGPRDSDDCPIPGEVVGPALNNYSAIEAAFPGNSPGRYTPTGEALQLVCEALPGVAADMRPQYVILATDGEPNSCEGRTSGGVDYQSVIDAANLCCSKGVTIYVISLASGGQEFQDHLQQVADIGACNSAGGGATVYSPQDPAQLSTDLGQLIGGAVTCDVLLSGSVVQGKECEGSVVTLNGRALGCNDADGWILLAENVIRLQGAACQEFTDNPSSVLTATFPCEVFIPGGGGPGGGSAGSGSGGGTAGSGSGGPGDLGPIF